MVLIAALCWCSNTVMEMGEFNSDDRYILLPWARIPYESMSIRKWVDNSGTADRVSFI